jgi:hypothetical protein
MRAEREIRQAVQPLAHSPKGTVLGPFSRGSGIEQHKQFRSSHSVIASACHAGSRECIDTQA